MLSLQCSPLLPAHFPLKLTLTQIQEVAWSFRLKGDYLDYWRGEMVEVRPLIEPRAVPVVI